MSLNKKSIYKRTWFFYKGALVVKAPKVVKLMMKVSRTSAENRIEACAFLPGVFFVNDTKNFTHYLCNHEAIHVRQVWDCMILSLALISKFDISWGIGVPLILISYWILYLADFLVIRTFLHHHDAYLLSAFEQEAWLNESNKKYLGSIKYNRRKKILQIQLGKRIPFTWFFMMIDNVLFLPFKVMRQTLLYKIKSIRFKRKQYLYWSQNFKQKKQKL